MSVCPDQPPRGGPLFTGPPAIWTTRPYDGGPYKTGLCECSYCGSLHPEDVIKLIEGGAEVERTTKTYKLYLRAPNLVAGKRVKVGSRGGPVFDRMDLRPLERMTAPVRTPDGKASLRERITGRYDRPMYGTAPQTTHSKVYLWHFTPEQIDRLNQALGLA